jgi:hypothetical protein
MIMRLDAVEDDRQRFDQRCSGVITQDVGTAKIGLPVLEDRPQIKVDDVVLLDVADGRVIGRKRQRIGAGARDALVPMFLDAELLQRDGINFLFDVPLGSACPDKSTPFDLVKQRRCSLLGGNQRRAPIRLSCLFLFQTGSSAIKVAMQYAREFDLVVQLTGRRRFCKHVVDASTDIEASYTFLVS